MISISSAKENKHFGPTPSGFSEKKPFPVKNGVKKAGVQTFFKRTPLAAKMAS
jgi:hypothetical protein